jgi:hypothetical protein
VRVPISEATGADPTSDPVSLAFPTTGTEPSVFVAGNWRTVAGIHYAQALVGPGGAIVLTPGFYDVYVQITDNPEVPVLFAGTLEVT